MENNIENNKSAAASREETVLEFWKDQDIFNKTLAKESPQGEFVFYEGPPTANGKPGIHHLEARAFKDAIPRYKTMRGYHVRRKGGWDTHGLPVELQVEKKLGLNSKKMIEEYGIAKFNNECKESVWEYLDIWNKFTKRIGYWVDQENPYVTYHNNYIESAWNVLKTVNDKKLLYKDYKVVPWCPRCGTALSSHELAQGYEDVKDLSVYAKFKVVGQENTYILAWTTTPWTLPGNVALAVGSDIEYVKVKMKDSSETYIVAKDLLVKNFSLQEGADGYSVESLSGKDLIGLRYEPLYPYLKDALEKKRESTEKAFTVYPADFVTTTDGTGVVHTAIMYGQDDFELGTKIGLPKLHTVDDTGHFILGTEFLEGRFVKDEEVAVDIIKDLAHRGLLFKKEKYEHSYPHCWRCKTPLIYYARDSWYIRMSDGKIKEKMIAENKEINWEPSYIRDGRFGEWLKDIKDWAISRERYWGTPLPIWQKTDGTFDVVGSLEELKKKTKTSGNKYFVMRHGGTGGNLKELVSYVHQETDGLTPAGKEDVIQRVKQELIGKNIDLIIASPFTRTRETADLVIETLGMPKDSIVFDDRLKEVDPGEFDGKSWTAYHQYVHSNGGPDWFKEKIGGGESLEDVKKRTAELLYELEEKYKGRNILIITHGGPAWLLFVNAGLFTPENKEYQVAGTQVFVSDFKRFSNGEVRELPFVPVPHNEDYELDFHKPYIDSIELVDEKGDSMKRVKEVMDVWFDSGVMPFAQDHYPFENEEWVDTKGFPADYISEAIDQTRGWFYTLHAVGILTGRGKAYKNVICLGHILDEKGKKMSKSLGNIVDPWLMMEKYGVDTLRLWMYSVNQPGESKNFDEKTVAELNNKVFNLLYNVLAFYDLYRDTALEKESYDSLNNILDQWIVSRVNQLAQSMTESLDSYKLLEPVRALRSFIDDLSTWYVRRSRERLKEGDADAKKTLYYVLKKVSTLMAPFAPFAAEDIWQKLKNETDTESVHLSSWPADNDVDEHILSDMESARSLVTMGLEARQKAGIKVRQPLGSLKVKNWNLGEDYALILKDELNVKSIDKDNTLAGEIELDLAITPELKKEGQYRELVRAIQDMRKKEGLNPSEIIVLAIETNDEGSDLINMFKDELLNTVGAKDIKFVATQGSGIKIDELSFVISIAR
ncbi:MAG: class I tRNA ligase family protein [Patescibacteria group bacterium]